MASLTDKLTRISDSDTGRPVIAQLAGSGKDIGATSITLNAATNWTTTTKIHFAIYSTTTVSGKTIKDTATQTEWLGTLSGTTISNLTLTGGTDQTYLAGVYVELTPTAKYAKDLYDGLAVLHNPDGTFKAGAVSTTATLADSIVTTTKIADSNVTFPKLATGSLRLGLAKRATTALLTTTLTTYLTVTATSTGKECEASFLAFLINANSGASRDITIQVTCDGTVVDSTLTLSAPYVGTNNNPYLTASFVVSSTPAAGSHTWNLQLASSVNTSVNLINAYLRVAEIV